MTQMVYSVRANKPPKASSHFDDVFIEREGRPLSTWLSIDIQEIVRYCGAPGPLALDLLLAASAVYAVDRATLRKRCIDRWTRRIELSVPVRHANQWLSVRTALSQCLGFLTGDAWSIRFRVRDREYHLPPQTVRVADPLTAQFHPAAVCLFSGGLDSLIGAVDWLESHREDALMLVGHYDPAISGPRSDQLRLYSRLSADYPDRVRFASASVGPRLRESDLSSRSRSLLFIALGVCAASAIGPETELLMPENGMIALNPPLTPSRRGTCSTRTAHPSFMDMLTDLLTQVGFRVRISNPLALKTKGESVEQCMNRELLERIACESVSCSKRGHRSGWVRRGARACGRCIPCIYRRAALNRIGLDSEEYGCDVCSGEVDVSSHNESTNDLRACLSYCRRELSVGQIAVELAANGYIAAEQASSYARIVQCSMEEIRALFADKATDELKRELGIVVE